VIRRHCRCGSGLHAYPTPGGQTDKVVAQFDRQHTGDGHGPAEQPQPADENPTQREEP
jgi:hypothetical protein